MKQQRIPLHMYMYNTLYIVRYGGMLWYGTIWYSMVWHGINTLCPTYIATFLLVESLLHGTVQLTFSFSILSDRFRQSHVFRTTLSLRLTVCAVVPTELPLPHFRSDGLIDRSMNDHFIDAHEMQSSLLRFIQGQEKKVSSFLDASVLLYTVCTPQKRSASEDDGNLRKKQKISGNSDIQVYNSM